MKSTQLGPTPVVLLVLAARADATTIAAAQQDQPAPQSPTHSAADQPQTDAPPAGILPLPDYSGDFLHRPCLTGDWNGTRTDLANKGVQFDVTWNQYIQSVVGGGRDYRTRYGGTADYLINFDLQRMGLLPGALLKFRAESRYGDSVNSAAGPILPVNTDAFFPLTDRLDETIPFTITNLLYTQFLSTQFALFLGKLDTLDGDPNEFASGRGTSQFMNANFSFNPALALRLPYSTLGAGIVFLPCPNVTINSSVINTIDSSTTTGFDDFGDGLTWTTEANFQYRLGTLPGGQNVGFLYSFDQDFTQLGGRFIFQPGQGLSASTEDETWAVYWSAWQYLFVEDPTDAPISLANGEQDHQGLGLFARVGFADEDTNPVEWSVSAGIGARGIFPTRDNDTIGVGYYYASIQTLRISGIAGIRDEAQGLEAFYNLALTPATHLTFDAQILQSPSTVLDTAVVLGLRFALRF